MDSLNTLRAILVGAAFIAAVILALQGRWVPVVVLSVGIVAHGLLWLYLWKTGAFDRPKEQRKPLM
ncbi:MAG: hypothetical protein R3343_13695 [Nitriliruptorales bacterium]|nr:hypothetical protein [Nitriliruptorales bacterium]